MSPTRLFPFGFAALALTSLGWAQELQKGVPASVAPAVPSDKVIPLKRATALEFNIVMREGLRFDPPRISVMPGDELTIQLENGDTTHQTHNFLVLNPGTLKSIVDAAMALGEKGPTQNFVPLNADVLAHSSMLDAEKTGEVKFKMPADPGIYPYVCSMPGHGMVMYGAIYSGVTPPLLDKDPNLPPNTAENLSVGAGRRPFVQRMFMPDAGPAAIAVALPGTQNFCWDAGQCRLRYVWEGSFIDAGDYWKGNGNSLAKIGGDPWWRAALEEFPFRFGDAKAAAPNVTFLGYSLIGGLPEFHYRAGQAEVFEKITLDARQSALSVHYRVAAPSGPLFYQVKNSETGRWSSSVGEFKDGVLSLTASQAADFTLTLSLSL